jgi:hypothetical protein
VYKKFNTSIHMIFFSAHVFNVVMFECWRPIRLLVLEESLSRVDADLPHFGARATKKLHFPEQVHVKRSVKFLIGA